ncbi:MAG: hypothetical protein EOP48_30510 [Sphingobacteriales bacterium]|nr:MAG: hypothetical protein EOP48_30510 [Sphingobacteriales bacterium]
MLQYILKIASCSINRTYEQFDAKSIGVHIRLGDYSEESKVPISWYVKTIKILQADVKYQNTIFIIFSDGKDDELKDILAIPNCKRVDRPNALADILSGTCAIEGSTRSLQKIQGFAKVSAILAADIGQQRERLDAHVPVEKREHVSNFPDTWLNSPASSFQLVGIVLRPDRVLQNA